MKLTKIVANKDVEFTLNFFLNIDTLLWEDSSFFYKSFYEIYS